MNKYAVLHAHTHYSLMDAISKPKDIAKKCVELDIPAFATTDHGNCSSHIQFLQEMVGANKKALLGCELYISRQDATIKDATNRKLDHLVLIAKNKDGWRSLIRAVSKANYPDLFYYKPRLDLNRLAEYVGPNTIAIDGHLGSVLSTKIFKEDSPHSFSSVDDAKQYIDGDWLEKSIKHIGFMQEIFGRENYFLEIQPMDKDNLPQSLLLMQGIRHLGYRLKIPVVPTPDSHYVNKEDAQLQRIMLCSSMNITLDEAYHGRKNGKEVGLSSFFNSRNYFIPSYEEMLGAGSEEEELENTLMVADLCDEYELKNPPLLPKFPLPKNVNSDEHLKELCRIGWKERKGEIDEHIKNSSFVQEDYVSRLDEEFGILSEVGLSDYFLIVKDLVDYTRNSGSLLGAGRGSAAGSLILWLLNVTQINPIKHGLLFSRFYNSGRNTKDHVSLPDVDLDFEHSFRENILEYLREKYGHRCVSQICTFSRLQGRAALKEVLRINNACDFATANEISKPIPDESEISDKLQSMKDERGESSIILWALENKAKELEKYVSIDSDGFLQGDYAIHFKQAIAIEGTIKTSSKHAAGVAIADTELENICPMMYDKTSKELITSFDLESSETIGILKLDCLSTAVLDKIHGILNLLRTGKLF